MFNMEANIDAWPMPTSSDVMEPDALVKIGIGPHTAKVFNTQNKNLYLFIAKALPEVVLDCFFETQVGDPDTHMRTIQVGEMSPIDLSCPATKDQMCGGSTHTG